MKIILKQGFIRKIVSALLLLTATGRAADLFDTNTQILLPLTNWVHNEKAELTNSEPEQTIDARMPLIQFYNIPISTAIENLARQVEINYLLDPRLSSWWKLPGGQGYSTHEPNLVLRWENITVRDALIRVLFEHNLVLLDDPVTSVAWITYSNQPIPHVDTSLLPKSTNVFVPLIQMEDVPVDQALKTLVDNAGINVVINPQAYAEGVVIFGKRYSNPAISIGWQNISARQAIIALCKWYNLVIVKDPQTGTVEIKPGS